MNPKNKRLVVSTVALILLIAASLTVSAQMGGAGVQKQSATGVMGLLYSGFEIVGRYVFFFTKSLMSLIEDSLLANPEIYPLTYPPPAKGLTPNGKIYQNIFIVLAPIYAMSILILGAYMVFMSHSPRGRAQAKMMLDKLIVSMVIVPASPAIYEILLQTSNIVARSVLSTVLVETGKETIGDAFLAALGIATTPLWGMFIISPHLIGIIVIWLGITLLFAMWIAILMMWFRYLTVKVFAFLFPLILFMYLFSWTRHIGAMLLKYTLIWVFTPVISAVFLATGIVLVYSSPVRVTGSLLSGAGLASHLISIILNPLFLTVALALTWIAPLVMSGVMRVLGGIVSSVGMVVPGGWGLALAAIGGVMQGKSAAELATVGVKYAGAKSMKNLKAAASGKKQDSMGAGGEKKDGKKKRKGFMGRMAGGVGSLIGKPGGYGAMKGAAKKTRAAASASVARKRKSMKDMAATYRASRKKHGRGRSLVDVAKSHGPAAAARKRASAVQQGFQGAGAHMRASGRLKESKSKHGTMGRDASRAKRTGFKGRMQGAAAGARNLMAGARDAAAGAKGGFKGYNDRVGAGKAGKLSRDLRSLESSGKISGENAQKLQDAGLTSNSKIAHASDDKLAGLMGGDENAASNAKGGALEADNMQKSLKDNLGSPGYRMREGPNVLDSEEQQMGDDAYQEA